MIKNKTSSAVQLKHIPTGMVIKCQATRSRTQNRTIARRLLAEKLDFLEKGAESRIAVKGEVNRKRKASKAKKARRKYRGLNGDGAAEGTIDQDETETIAPKSADADGELPIMVEEPSK